MGWWGLGKGVQEEEHSLESELVASVNLHEFGQVTLVPPGFEYLLVCHFIEVSVEEASFLERRVLTYRISHLRHKKKKVIMWFR